MSKVNLICPSCQIRGTTQTWIQITEGWPVPTGYRMLSSSEFEKWKPPTRRPTHLAWNISILPFYSGGAALAIQRLGLGEPLSLVGGGLALIYGVSVIFQGIRYSRHYEKMLRQYDTAIYCYRCHTLFFRS